MPLCPIYSPNPIVSASLDAEQRVLGIFNPQAM